MAKPRDYKREYRLYQGTPQQIKNRAARNHARRECIKRGLLHKHSSSEVDHKIPLKHGGSNAPSNWRVVSRTVNRRKGSKRRG